MLDRQRPTLGADRTQATCVAPQARRPIRCNLFGGFQGRQATRGGDRLQTVPLECQHNVQTHKAEDIDTGRSRKKAPSPVYVDDAFDAWSSDQSDAGATIA